MEIPAILSLKNIDIYNGTYECDSSFASYNLPYLGSGLTIDPSNNNLYFTENNDNTPNYSIDLSLNDYSFNEIQKIGNCNGRGFITLDTSGNLFYQTMNTKINNTNTHNVNTYNINTQEINTFYNNLTIDTVTMNNGNSCIFNKNLYFVGTKDNYISIYEITSDGTWGKHNNIHNIVIILHGLESNSQGPLVSKMCSSFLKKNFFLVIIYFVIFIFFRIIFIY
jgi:hypothetical protein